MREERRGPRRFGGFGERRSFAPVKVGDEIDVKIESVGAKGDGVAKVQGFVLFVPGAKEGQEVRVRVTRVLKKVGFAEIVGESAEVAEKPEEGKEESYYTKEEETEEKTEELEGSETFGEEEGENF